MKSKLWIIMLLVVLLITSACSDNQGENQADNSSSNSKGEVSSNETASGSAKGPFGKYEPPIEVSVVRSTNAGIIFVEGESFENNIWTDIFKEELGIKVNHEWVVDVSQYRQKLNVTIASGSLPDIMEVNKTELQRLVDADMIADLTDIYDEYASPFLKEIYSKDGGTALSLATFNDKLMAIPITQSNGGVSSADMIWVRTDWLQQLNLPEPKTMEDVLKIAEAFSEQDPDQDGQDDTYALGIHNKLYGGIVGSLNGFFNGYHAYPNIWIKDASGGLVYGSIQPEVKQALKKLNEFYENGMLDREFAVKDTPKVQEDIAAERIGLLYGGVAAATANAGIKESRANNPDAQWQAYPIVSIDGETAMPQVPDTAENFYVVSKEAKHPEAAFKLLNVYLEKFLNTEYSSGMENPFAIDEETGAFPAQYAPLQVQSVTHNRDAYLKVVKALENNDGSNLTFPASLHYERNVKFREGDDSMWFSDRTFGPEGSFSVIDRYFKQEQYLFNAYLGAPTDTMVEKSSTLQKMQDEVFTRIIMGESPIDEFDKFVEDWKNLGGDTMTQEVNAWFEKNG